MEWREKPAERRERSSCSTMTLRGVGAGGVFGVSGSGVCSGGEPVLLENEDGSGRTGGGTRFWTGKGTRARGGVGDGDGEGGTRSDCTSCAEEASGGRPLCLFLVSLRRGWRGRASSSLHAVRVPARTLPSTLLSLSATCLDLD